MADASFEWDWEKERENRERHGVPFELAQYAFADPVRVLAYDVTHSRGEDRFFCFGRVGERILTVRFTYREGKIRIFGAGYWRKGKKIYEKENRIR